MATKPSIPKGTRDFSPQEMLRRKYIFSTIEKVFQKYGFLPLETPAMENLETLTGKYGEEGDRLIFKVLNSGDAWGGVSENVKRQVASGESVPPGRLASELSDKALRYDLTVPFARYVVQHQNEITFPFKRYQIQPVWRADRPQKGRYREFYQCDADVIGSTSFLNEVELVQIFDDVFTGLQLPVLLKINNRKLLQGAADYCGCSDRLGEIAVAIDKVDKIGRDAVVLELTSKGFPQDRLDDLFDCIFIKDEDLRFYGSVQEVMDQHNYAEEDAQRVMKIQTSPYHRAMGMLNCLSDRFGMQSDLQDPESRISPTGLLGCREMEQILGYLVDLDLKYARVELDTSLARGLDYYTGAIFEVKSLEGSMPGSICGGGRYDDLTGIFGLKNMSGVGISFGADRIYDVLLETNKFPAELGSSTRLLFANFGEKEAMHCLKLLRQVRDAGIAAELYPDAVKMAKQFKYADDKGIAFVAIIGENEMKASTIALKDMESGEQRIIGEKDLLSAVQV